MKETAIMTGKVKAVLFAAALAMGFVTQGAEKAKADQTMTYERQAAITQSTAAYLNRSLFMTQAEKDAVVKGFEKGLAQKISNIEQHKYQAALWFGNNSYRKEVYGMDQRSLNQQFEDIDRAESFGAIVGHSLTGTTEKSDELVSLFSHILHNNITRPNSNDIQLPSHTSVHRIDAGNIEVALKNLESTDIHGHIFEPNIDK